MKGYNLLISLTDMVSYRRWKKGKLGTEMGYFRLLLTADTAISVTNGIISVKKGQWYGAYLKMPTFR